MIVTSIPSTPHSSALKLKVCLFWWHRADSVRSASAGICEAVAGHVGRISMTSITIHQMTLYFKVGEDSRVWLLWCSHIATTPKVCVAICISVLCLNRALFLQPLPGISHTAPTPRRGRLRSPELRVPPNTEYSRKQHTVMEGVPCCAVCGKTVGRPEPRSDGVGTANHQPESANGGGHGEAQPNDPAAAVIPSNLAHGSDPLSQKSPKGNVPKSFYAQKSGVDECGAWSLTYETVLR